MRFEVDGFPIRDPLDKPGRARHISQHAARNTTGARRAAS